MKDAKKQVRTLDLKEAKSIWKNKEPIFEKQQIALDFMDRLGRQKDKSDKYLFQMIEKRNMKVFKQSHNAEKCKTLGFINTHPVANYQKTRRGDREEGPFSLVQFCRLP